MTTDTTTPEIYDRPSFLDVVAACPSAAIESVGKAEPGNEYTARGQAIHKGIERTWNCRADHSEHEPSKEFVDSLAREYGIDLEFESTKNSIMFAIRWLEEHMPNAQLEVHVGPGTVDALQVNLDEEFQPVEALIADFKGRVFGREEADSMYQQLAYVVAVADKYGVLRVTATLVYHAQDGVPQRIVFDEAAIQAARDEINSIRARAIDNAKRPVDRRDYRDGDWCSRCKGAATCPAIVVRSQQIGTMLRSIADGGTIVLDEKSIPRTWAMVKRIEDAASEFRKLILRGIDARGGQPYVDETGEVRMQRDKLPALKPKYEDLLAALMKRNPPLAAELDREVAGSLPVSAGFKAPYAKLYPKKVGKAGKTKETA